MVGRILLYFRFLAGLATRRGWRSYPSPAREFILEAVRGEDVPGLDGIEELRRSLRRNRKLLPVVDHGAGSRRAAQEGRTVRHLVRTTAVSPAKGRLLARIARYFNFPLVVELGTGTGISSLYMGMACPRSRILTCEGSPAIAGLAGSNIREMGVSNIEVTCDVFLDWLPETLRQVPGELLLFLDGDHRGERLLQYCSMVFNAGLSRAVLVLDDIHWSAGMYKAWKEQTVREEVSLSLELFNTGIILAGFGFPRVHLIRNF
jgi:predicted O-methyltransferase YrrM